MGLITPDFGLAFWMILSFGIVLFVLKKFAWKPILQTLHQRELSIANALNSAEETKLLMLEMKNENQRVMNEAKMERERMLIEAKDMRDRIIRESEADAKARSSKILEQAQQEIDARKDKALKEISDKVAELSVNIAEKILQNELSKDKAHEQFVDNLIKEMKLN